MPYNFQGADQLLCDVFDEVEQSCKAEGIALEFDDKEIELEPELTKHRLIKLEKEGREVRPVPLASRVNIDLIQGTYTLP